MAKIIENKKGRRQIRLDFADISTIICEYQTQYARQKNITELQKYFEYNGLYLPEEKF